jgi:hypothetical protein
MKCSQVLIATEKLKLTTVARSIIAWHNLRQKFTRTAGDKQILDSETED